MAPNKAPAVRPRRGRDRHGRGLRGPLAPPGVPVTPTRSEMFDDLVEHAVGHLAERWGAQLAEVEFAVDDVPRAGFERGVEGVEHIDAGGVPLASVLRSGDRAPQIVVYRRPLEVRSADQEELAELAHDVVVEAVARLLGLDPGAVDPAYGDDG